MSVIESPTSNYNYLKLLWLLLLVPLWTLQYGFVVPVVWVWRAIVVPAFKVGGFLIVLVFVPVVGWIVILLVLLVRRPQQVVVLQADGSTTSLPSKSRWSIYLSPWGATLLS